MDKPIVSKETVRLLFDLGIEILKTMKIIYETRTEERSSNDNTTENTNRDSKKDINHSD